MNEEIKEILDNAKLSKRTILTYEESRRIMELAGISLNKMEIAKDFKESVIKANSIGYPVALKVVSKDVLHKSDSGGVKVGIKSEEELKEAYDDMLSKVKGYYPNAKIEGFSIEEMVEGVELLIGTNTDSQFGKMIALGIGGIFVEVYKDVSFRLIPVEKEDVEDMINEIKGRKILDGYRGKPSVDKEELISLVLQISKLIEQYPSIKEMDLNPVVATEKGLRAIDARIILE
ncbi:MAG: acetate--CoA ligase family protein [Candidatus Thorarchaeota archaeon]